MDLTIVLFEPETAGNVGAIARLMHNFGVEKLVLINPKCDHISKEAVDRATHGRHLLENAVVGKASLLAGFDLVVGTTGKLGTDYNIRRSPVLADNLHEHLGKGSVALVFGRESSGLLNEEIRLCDFCVTIPCKNQPLNISHAVCVVLYELFKAEGKNAMQEQFSLVPAREKKELMRSVDKALDKMVFSTIEKRDTQKIVWRHVLGKAALTKREAVSLLGFFKKL